MFQPIKKDSGEGVVCAVNKTQILVAPLPQDADAALPKKSCGPRRCGSCGGCPSISDGYAGNKFRVTVNNPVEFNLGDRVHFNRFIPNSGIASLLIFGLPLIFTMIAIMFYRQSFAVALGGLICGFVVLGIIDSIFKKRYPPSIIAKESQ